MDARSRKVLFSSASDHWSTPSECYGALNREFSFDFDPCPLRADFDGLTADWIGSIFINPPYSRIRAFLNKAMIEIKHNADVIVFLVPARTDTKWFHELVLGRAEVRFLRGRLKFGGQRNNAPFPSMLCIFRREQTC